VLVGTDEGGLRLFVQKGGELLAGGAAALHEDTVRGAAVVDHGAEETFVVTVAEDGTVARTALEGRRRFGATRLLASLAGGCTGVSSGVSASGEVVALVGGWQSDALVLLRVVNRDAAEARALKAKGSGRAAAVAVTPDGLKGVVATTNDPEDGAPQVWVWDLQAESLVASFRDASEWVARGFGAALSADASLAVTSTWDRAIQLWRVDSALDAAESVPRKEERLQVDRSITALAFQPGWCATPGASEAVVALGDQDGGVHLLTFSPPTCAA
jgi:hypothetical protein